VAIPAEDLTVGKRIRTIAVLMVRLPGSTAFSATVAPDELLVASPISVLVSFPPTFAVSLGAAPGGDNDNFRKCHTYLQLDFVVDVTIK